MAMPHDLSLESLGYTPHCLTETTADTTVALLLVTARRVGEAMAAVAQTPLSSSTHPLNPLSSSLSLPIPIIIIRQKAHSVTEPSQSKNRALIFAKDTCVFSKEPYMSVKGPYISAREAW